MAGASAQTQRVRFVNANWTSGRTDDEAFELMVVTEDEERHLVATTAAQLAVLVALTQARDVVMLWDPEGRTLIAGNLLGEWIPLSWSAGDAREAEGSADS